MILNSTTKVKFKISISIVYLEAEQKISFLVQNNLYVKQILRGGWSGFGMVRSWDGSQLIGMNPNISSFYPKLIPTERCSTILPQEANGFFLLQIYVCSTHFEVGCKVGKHDIWAWTPNNLKISNVSPGHKILKFPPKKVVPQFLSLHIIFSIIVYIGHNLVCIQNEQNTIFDFVATKFGALLILQECPNSCDLQPAFYLHPHCLRP